jgi:protein phosphatase
MGGHAAGEVASAVAIAGVASLDEDDPGSDLLDALRETALAANERLRDMVAGDSGLDGMGTTLTALLFAGSRLGLLHIGDSRCYLLRGGELAQITTDHTLVQTLVAEGRISEEEASTHPQRSLITRALDGRGSIDPDLSVREARVGDRYLLCTDGLTGPVGRAKTLQEALQLADPQEAVDRLVELALRGGAPDNVTVIVADVVDTNAGAAVPVVAGAAAEQPQSPPPPVGDTPAARARVAEGRATPPPRPSSSPVVPDPPDRPRRTGRLLLLSLVLLGLLGGGAVAGWSYVRSQYFVGVDGSTVAVFRGVDAELAGVSLASVEQRTDLDMDALDDVARRTVERGYVADDREDADAFVARLARQAAARCEQQAAAAAPPAPAAPAPAPPGTAPVPAPAPTPSTPAEADACPGTAS